MKRFYKACICAMITSCMVLLSSCDDGGALSGGREPDNKDSTSVTTTDTGCFPEPDEEEPLASEVRDPMLTYFGSRSLGDSEAESFFISSYEKKYCSEFIDKTTGKYTYPDGRDVIQHVYCSEAALNDRLSELIVSDSSPDLVDYRAEAIPYLSTKNFYEDLSEYIDLEAEHFNTGLRRSIIESYRYNDRVYYLPWEYNVSPQLLCYDRSVTEAFGFADPYSLWKQGEWSWTGLVGMLDGFATYYEECAPLCGDRIGEALLASGGASFVTLDESGKLSRGAAISAAHSEYISTMRKYIHNGTTASLSDERVLFHSFDMDDLSGYRAKHPDADIAAVPYPSEDGAAPFYRVETFGYLVPKGSKNIDGATCFINLCVNFSQPDTDNGYDDIVLSEAAEQDMELWYTLLDGDEGQYVVDFGYGLPKEYSDSTAQMFRQLISYGEEQPSPDAVMEEHYALIEEAVAEINYLMT